MTASQIVGSKESIYFSISIQSERTFITLLLLIYHCTSSSWEEDVSFNEVLASSAPQTPQRDSVDKGPSPGQWFSISWVLEKSLHDTVYSLEDLSFLRDKVASGDSRVRCRGGVVEIFPLARSYLESSHVYFPARKRD